MMMVVMVNALLFLFPLASLYPSLSLFYFAFALGFASIEILFKVLTCCFTIYARGMDEHHDKIACFSLGNGNDSSYSNRIHQFDTHTLSLTHPEYMTIEEIHCIRYIALQLIH